MNEIQWMVCTTCKALVQLNATGICLGCQGGFVNPLEEETFHCEKEIKIADLKERQKEIEDAIQESSKEVPKRKKVKKK